MYFTHTNIVWKNNSDTLTQNVTNVQVIYGV